MFTVFGENAKFTMFTLATAPKAASDALKEQITMARIAQDSIRFRVFGAFAALATVLPVNRALAGARAAPAGARRFINVCRPRSPSQLVADGCGFAAFAPFRAEAKGLSCIFI